MGATKTGQPIEILEPIDASREDHAWRTILFNCNCHSFAEVIDVLQRATGCSPERAEGLAWIVHRTGSAEVYSGDKESCEAVAEILEAIGLKVSVEQ
jgi:ATP-dependent Clp protease adapter protein ClpS